MIPQRRLALFGDILEYPTARLAEQVMCLQSALSAESPFANFGAFVEREELVRVQELYTSTFDLNPACCPYIAYHLFGESFKRGALMAKLRETYTEHGFASNLTELPDHLATLLRFVAACADEELAQEILTELVLPALRTMAAAFASGSNPYGDVLRSLLDTLDPQLAPILAGGSLDV